MRKSWAYIAYTVTGQPIETWNRNELTAAAGELMPVTILDRAKARKSGRRCEVEVKKLLKKIMEIKGALLEEFGQRQTGGK